MSVVRCLESGSMGFTSPPTSRFLFDLKISLGPRDFPQVLPSGILARLGKSLGCRGCTTQYIPPLGSIRTQYLVWYDAWVGWYGYVQIDSITIFLYLVWFGVV